MERTREDAIRLIVKLQEIRLERGSTPAEAERAAAHIRRLLEKHQLSLLDVDGKKYNEDLDTEVVDLPGQVQQTWFHDLGSAVSRPLDCEYLCNTRWDDATCKRRVTISFVGYLSDVKVARYLFGFLSRTLGEIAERDGRRAGRYGASLLSYRKQFLSAAARTIERRLWTEKQASQAADPGCRALVTVKAPAVTKYFAEQFQKAKTIKTPKLTDAQAVADGIRAGKSVNIKQAVECQEEPKALA